MQSIVNSVLRDLLNVADLELTDLYGGNKIEQKLKKASHLILGTFFFTSYNLDLNSPTTGQQRMQLFKFTTFTHRPLRGNFISRMCEILHCTN